MVRLSLVLWILIALQTAARAETIELDSANLPDDVRERIAELDKLTARQLDPSADIMSALDLRNQIAEQREVIARALLGRGYDLWTGTPTATTCVDFVGDDVVPVPAVSGVPN
ncbi:hypothetical protein NKH56_32830 [Mesorhizobium sp. M1076]|uniref:hypothetical protein n=1 Tax=Mesorhizobium sp. M1076 TaxID=2957054 RepID=UPI003337B8DD